MTIQLILGLPIGLSETSTEKDRREKFIHRLKKVQVPELFCVLNSIFSMNFAITSLYHSLNDDQRKIALERMFKQLCYGVS